MVACQAADDDAQFRATYTTNVTLSGGDDGGPICEPDQIFNVNERRSLFETHEVALSAFTMPAVLTAMSTNSGLVSNPPVEHDQLIDIYNTAPGLGMGQHCDDDVAFTGGPGINGYPLQCPRAEGGQIGNVTEWFPIAAVNRFDLAPQDGSNCGEARLVLANSVPIGPGRFFTIFEAQVPNPNPECGIDACAPVQEFWANLTNIDDPVVRGEELEMAFLDGHPDLLAAGFPPFVRQQAFTFGTGQVRTNNFDQGPWTLREFKAIAVKPDIKVEPIDPKEGVFGAQGGAIPVPGPSGLLRFVEVAVAANPFGELWDDTNTLPTNTTCQKGIVNTVGNLMNDNPNLMAVDVPPECLAAESPTGFANEYDDHLANGSIGPLSLTAAIQAEILANDPSSTLTPTDIARRAVFAGACMGCHQLSNFGANNNLGNGVSAPQSLGFVHTSEFSQENCGDGDVQCFVISNALKDSFLPHRKSVMDTYLNGGPCCEDNDGPDIGPAPTPVPIEEVDAEALMEAEAEAEATAPPSIGGAKSARAH
ncbi:MAG: hypothetical protein K0V04_35840 [Deltaproteobacteria bacterium]|nr:hypothetical protein [Deltaproteobacteria bacterium]